MRHVSSEALDGVDALPQRVGHRAECVVQIADLVAALAEIGISGRLSRASRTSSAARANRTIGWVMVPARSSDSRAVMPSAAAAITMMS